MPSYVAVPADDAADAAVILVEIRDADRQLAEVGRGDRVIAHAASTFETLTRQIRPVAEGVLRALRDSTTAPDEVQVQLGVSFNAEADVVISRAAAEANFSVTMTWKRELNPTVAGSARA